MFKNIPAFATQINVNLDDDVIQKILMIRLFLCSGQIRVPEQVNLSSASFLYGCFLSRNVFVACVTYRSFSSELLHRVGSLPAVEPVHQTGSVSGSDPCSLWMFMADAT